LIQNFKAFKTPIPLPSSKNKTKPTKIMDNNFINSYVNVTKITTKSKKISASEEKARL
jgi:hypothetical protein